MENEFEILTRRYRNEDDAAYSLIQSMEEDPPVDCSLRSIVIQLLVIWTLESRLERIQRVDQ